MSEPSANPTRRALRALTHGVYVLSVHYDQQDDFLILSLVMQCSVEPPRIAMALAHGARILPALAVAQGGVLGVLDDAQKAAVRRYGAPGGVRNPPRDAQRTERQHAIPPEVSFWIEFSVMSTTIVGDHTLIVANVTSAGVTAALSVPDVPAATPQFEPMTLAGSKLPYGG